MRTIIKWIYLRIISRRISSIIGKQLFEELDKYEKKQ